MTPLTRASIGFIIPLLLAAQPLDAQQENNARPVVVTTGEAVMYGAPDQAFITISSEARASNPRQAQRQNADAMDKVQKKLRESDIPPDAVRTLQYDVQPEFDYSNGKQTLRGYVSRNSIEVRVDDVMRVGDVLDKAVGSGATSVSNIRFDLKNREALERSALRAAVADARARADAAAAGAGASVERVIRIEEQRSVVRPPMAMMADMRSVEAVQVKTPIVAGDVEVRAMVTLTALIR
jgi:uncharacterized protein YggE